MASTGRADESPEEMASTGRADESLREMASTGRADESLREMASAGRADESPGEIDSTGMAKEPAITARDFFPGRSATRLEDFRRAAAGCQGCDLWQRGTQTVFGEGRVGALVMFVGEQPGDQEDRQGRPFVGPAGKLLDRALARVGIDRRDTYVTNIVKHFKWVPQERPEGGTTRRRLHERPNAGETRACRPWLEAEIQLVRPQAIV